MSDIQKRTATIDTRCDIKLNTGNFETVDFSKRIVVEVEYSTPKDLKEKSDKIDSMLIKMAQHAAEQGLDSMGRHRCTGVAGKDVKIGIWDDFENATGNSGLPDFV